MLNRIHSIFDVTKNRFALKQIIFLKNAWVIKTDVNVKIAKYVDFFVVCIEFTKMSVFNS